ncbi:MAG TPA: hypothetical protein VE422_10690 [Terriglobia bacterium]|nr:hypothetical protein [Terriglobia bacterium]
MTITVILYCLLLGLNIWFFWIRPARPWAAKLGVVLQILAMYTFALGVITQTDILPRNIAQDMTSPDLFRFCRANLLALGQVFLAASMGADPEKSALSAFAFLEPIVMIGLASLVFIYALFHLLVIVPLSYVAYVLVSVPLSAISASTNEIGLGIGNDVISFKEIISAHPIPIRNFLIAFPSIALKVSLDVLTSYRTTPPPPAAAPEPVLGKWLVRHPRMGKSVLVAGQIIAVLLLLVNVGGVLFLPWLVSSDAEQPVPIGEIVGAEIVMGLFVWVFAAFLLKLGRLHKAVGRPGRERARFKRG